MKSVMNDLQVYNTKSRVPTWLRRQLAVHVEPPQKQEPVAFRPAEGRGIVYDPIP